MYNCPATSFIDYGSKTFYGMFSYREVAQKTFSSLPPHWSLSIRFDMLLFASFDGGDYSSVLIDSSIVSTFTKGLNDF